MAKKKLFKTDKNADATRKAKPLGYRYKNLDPTDSRYFKRPTAEEIEKFKAGDKKMKRIIAFEDRPERSDKNQKNKLAKGGSLDIQFPNSNLYLVGKGYDKNGNYVVKVTFPNQTAFSIQTGGTLKQTESNLKSVGKISELTEDQILEIEKEVVDYVSEHGSKLQKSKLKKYSGFEQSDIEDEDDNDNDDSKREHIGHLIQEGYTSGYTPNWTLKIDFDGDIDDSDREHIGKEVTKGMTSGEIISGEEEKTGWWSIEIDMDDYKNGGEVTGKTKTISGVKHNIVKGEVDYHSMEELEEFSHPIGTVYSDGKYGYVASGYDWLRFDIKDLDRIKSRMKDGGSVGESEWLVVLEDKDGYEIDEIVFAKTEDEAYNKAELLHEGSKAVGINMLTDKKGKKIEYKHGGSVKRSKASIKQDKSIKALHAGKRESADGNTYYENRVNRSDKNRTTKLEKGGSIKPFSEQTGEWFDDLVDFATEHRTNETLQKLIDISEKTASKENLEKFKTVLNSCECPKPSLKKALLEQIDNILDVQYKKEFKFSFGGNKSGYVKVGGAKVSATSELFNMFNQASTYNDNSMKEGGDLWIQESIKKEGILRKKAKEMGLIHGDEKLSATDLAKLEALGGVWGYRARLARTLKKMEKGGEFTKGAEISTSKFASILGRTPKWNESEIKHDGTTFEKCFLRQYWKVI